MFKKNYFILLSVFSTGLVNAAAPSAVKESPHVEKKGSIKSRLDAIKKKLDEMKKKNHVGKESKPKS